MWNDGSQKDKVRYIQAVVKAWLERAAYLRLRNAAILMQAAERCLMCNASYDKEKLALLRAQRLSKAWLARRQYGRAMMASTCLQAAGQSYLANKWADENRKPMCTLIEDAEVGAKELMVSNAVGFKPQSFVYVGWGLDTEEKAVLVDFWSMLLLQPLEASHKAGEDVCQPDQVGGDARTYILVWEKAELIQAMAWLERAAYIRLRNAAILMQAAERCLMCSASYDKEKLALLRAQRLSKAWLARRQYGRAVTASVVMQAAGQAYLANGWLKTNKEKVTYI